MKKIMILLMVLVLLSLFTTTALADDDEWESDDIEIFGFKLEEVLSLGAGILASVLFVLTFLAYRRTRNTRHAFVAIAFLLFAIKGTLSGMELFFGEWDFVEAIIGFFDFAILATFFAGLMKK